MKKNRLLIASLSLASIVTVIACVKDPVSRTAPTPFPVAPSNASFVEEFDSVSTLTSKGWMLKNMSLPVGQTGWRQGRYESANMAQYKFLGPVPYLGFPAYSASKSPTDFVSCDVSAVNDFGKISAWLISPAVPMKNGDQIIFYTRATADQFYPVYTKDRMQVRANIADATVNLPDTGVGNFTRLLLDINPTYRFNDPAAGAGGYPQAWRKYTITLSGLPTGGVSAGRFAFRYLGDDAGLAGGTTGNNFPTLVGVDSVAFVRN